MTDCVLEDDTADEFGEDVPNEEQMADDLAEDPEMEAIKKRVTEMEAEANKLHNLHRTIEASTVAKPTNTSLTEDEKTEVDVRSIYVGNVDYGATAEELESHFRGCGAINRITILCNKFTGHPKGFAYVEFADKDAVEAAMALDDSAFRNRALKVMPKRSNIPGISTTNRPPRGGRFRARMMALRAAAAAAAACSFGFGFPFMPRMRSPRHRRRSSSYHFAPY